MGTSGIYEIRNTVNGRCYYGSAIDVERRESDHRKGLNGEYHGNGYLQRAWKKYGESAFTFSLLEIVDKKEDLIPREQVYLDEAFLPRKLRPYNICRVAGSLLGTRRTDECRARLSELKLGKPANPEAGAKISEKLRGRKKSLESIAKRTLSRMGFKHSDEARAKISLGKTGVKQTSEHIEKRAKHLRGRKLSQSQINGMREAHRSLSAEQVADIVARRKAGETYVDIAKDYNTTKDTIRNWCLREGGKINDRQMPEALRNEIFQSRLAGESQRSVCQRLRVGKLTVKKVYQEGLEAMAAESSSPPPNPEQPTLL
jgi:group I intron endonuclease